MADLEIGKPITLKIIRGSEEMTLEATPVKLESAVGEERELEEWGLSVREVTRPYANSQLLPDDKGVVVTTVRPGYAAAKAELTPGDVIKQVNGQPAEDLEAFMKLYDASVDEKQAQVLLTVARRQGTRTVLLKVTY
jgi:serine protease Do